MRPCLLTATVPLSAAVRVLHSMTQYILLAAARASVSLELVVLGNGLYFQPILPSKKMKN